MCHLCATEHAARARETYVVYVQVDQSCAHTLHVGACAHRHTHIQNLRIFYVQSLSSANRDTFFFIPSFPVCLFFLSPIIVMARISSTVLNSSRAGRHPWVTAIPGGSFSLWQLVPYQLWGFGRGLFQVEKVSFSWEFVDCFYHERVLDFVACFFCIYWDNN